MLCSNLTPETKPNIKPEPEGNVTQDIIRTIVHVIVHCVFEESESYKGIHLKFIVRVGEGVSKY